MYAPEDDYEIERAEREREKAAQLEHDQAIADLQFLLRHAHGRRTLLRLMNTAGLNQCSYAQEPHATAFNEGRRSVALALLESIHAADPKAYALMLTENIKPKEPKKENDQ